MKVGGLLRTALSEIEKAHSEGDAALVASRFGGEGEGAVLPVVLSLPTRQSDRREQWVDYRELQRKYLHPIQERLGKLMGVKTVPLYAANAIQTFLSPPQVKLLEGERDLGLDLVELDPLVQATMMDDVVSDIDLTEFKLRFPAGDGSDVKVAVLDSGVDEHQPFLKVDSSVTTCGESIDLPGNHGTHCAGSIASQDTIFRGVAPGVSLLNVKVLRADGTGRHSFITKGIDEGLDLGAEIISMSLGFNHLPAWSLDGHGWSCTDGRCTLCVAVDNASGFDNVVVVVAAGNQHQRAEALRSIGKGHTFDTELGCPGQARQAITVGALTKRTFLPAQFTSFGPTAYGTNKPDLCAPGVNIISTMPVPRGTNGKPILSPPRATLFGRMSGTSMATPIVAGAAALLVQSRKQSGATWNAADIKHSLLTDCVLPCPFPPNIVGEGRLSLINL